MEIRNPLSILFKCRQAVRFEGNFPKKMHRHRQGGILKNEVAPAAQTNQDLPGFGVPTGLALEKWKGKLD